MGRWDIIWNGSPNIERHYCREWDADGGCYGTNPNHGFSYNDACLRIADWHEQQAQYWREKSNHPERNLQND